MDFGYDPFGFYGYEYYPWAGSSEKSRHAKRRENEATSKFDSLKNKMQTAMVENTIFELRGPQSHSPLKSVPTVLLNNIFGFVFGQDYEGFDAKEDTAATAAASAAGDTVISSRTLGRRPRKAVNYSELNVDQLGNDTTKISKVEVETGIDFSDMSLYEPGNIITIPLTKPNHHLTQPCYRDLRKHVKKNPGWDLKRIAISEEEKKSFKKPKITRTSTCYYVNAIFKVPGKPQKKRAAPAKKASSKKKAKVDGDSKPEAKKKVDPAATAALQEAVNSAMNDTDGKVDVECLQRALEAGFSKFFVLAEAAKQKEEADSKPAAKSKAKKQKK